MTGLGNAKSSRDITLRHSDKQRRIVIRGSQMARHFPVFQDRPTDAFVEAWRLFTAETGRPEDFTNVSTTKPSRDAGDIVLLSEEIAVPIQLREGGEMVPCPFCSTGSPKFKRGRMAFFPTDRTVRFIGHRCAARHFGDSYTEAERLFRRQAACRRFITMWKAVAEKLPALNPMLSGLQSSAEAFQTVLDRVTTQAPGFCAFLHRELAHAGGNLVVKKDLGGLDKNGNPVIQEKSLGTAAGIGVLDPEATDMTQDMLKVILTLESAQTPLPDWEATTPEHDATDEILKRGRALERAARQFLELRDRLSGAYRFFERKNIALIEKWGSDPSTPFVRFELRYQSGQLLIRSNSYAGDHYVNSLVPEGLSKPVPSEKHEIFQWAKALLD